MDFISNENFPYPSINILRNSDYSVLSVADNFQGISDSEVISIAKNQQRIILTFDKDYGELIFKQKIKSPPPVIFFRFKGYDPYYAGNHLIRLIKNIWRFRIDLQ